MNQATTSADRSLRGQARSASLGVDLPDAFTRTVRNLAPALKYDTPQVVLQVSNLTCYDFVGRPVAGKGAWTMTMIPQAILSLGQLSANFPFAVTYNPKPPSYVARSDGTFNIPGPVADWLNFVAKAGTDATPSLELTAGASIGLSLTIGSTCRNLPPISIAAATLGYSIDSATTKPMPGIGGKVTLDAKSCIGLNEPLNINLFVDPATGRPDLNPFGNFTVANLGFCDQPTITGHSVMADVTKLKGASVNQSSMTFDPSKSGPESVPSWGTFFPTEAKISFSLSSFSYHPDYRDGYKLTYTVMGQPVISTPAISPFNVSFAGLKAADLDVNITAVGVLKVRGLDPGLACSKIASGCVHGPPAAPICGIPAAWSQFAVSAKGLLPQTTYDLTLGGTAHGLTENKPIGPITTDKGGTVKDTIFTLPYIPAHDPWTLTATPRGNGKPVTATLETGVIDCIMMSAGGGSFQSQIAAVGLTPHTVFKEIVTGKTAGQVTSDADGTATTTEVDGSCKTGQVQVQLTGYWLDHGQFTDDATSGVNQYC